MTSAVVAVITFQRPKGLKRLLEGLAEQKVHASQQIEVLVVDNACEPDIRAMVESMAETFPFVLKYDQEPRRGIVAARNKCVELFLATGADNLFFIDDDSWPAEDNWIAEMLDKRARYGTDIVAGPTISILGEGTPPWANDVMHDFGDGMTDGTPISAYYTFNLLISRPVLEQIRPAFDERFRMGGGSDYHFSLKCSRAGISAAYVNAPVEEEFPRSRATVKWFLLRGYRSGIAYTKAHLIEEGRGKTVLRALGMSGVRAGRGCLYLLAALFTASIARAVNGLFRIASALGTIGGLFGASYQEYEVTHGE